jgi:Flp pilus assembly protein TadB
MEDRFKSRNRGVYGLIIFLIGAVVTHTLILWATQSPKIAAFWLCGIILIALILTKWRKSNLPPN